MSRPKVQGAKQPVQARTEVSVHNTPLAAQAPSCLHTPVIPYLKARLGGSLPHQEFCDPYLRCPTLLPDTSLCVCVFCLFVLCHTTWLVGSQFPDRGLNPARNPNHWATRELPRHLSYSCNWLRTPSYAMPLLNFASPPSSPACLESLSEGPTFSSTSMPPTGLHHNTCLGTTDGQQVSRFPHPLSSPFQSSQLKTGGNPTGNLTRLGWKGQQKEERVLCGSSTS